MKEITKQELDLMCSKLSDIIYDIKSNNIGNEDLMGEILHRQLLKKIGVILLELIVPLNETTDEEIKKLDLKHIILKYDSDDNDEKCLNTFKICEDSDVMFTYELLLDKL